MKQFPWKRITATAVGLALLSGAFFFPHAGRFLVVSDPFERADAGLVLSGQPIQRILAGRDLLLSGRVDRLLVIQEPSAPQVAGELVRLGLLDAERPEWSYRILQLSGAPMDRVVFLPPAQSTRGEAVVLRGYLRSHRIRRIVLVTDKFHTRRARPLFRWILKGEGVEILSFSNPYDPFEPDGWWRRPLDLRPVLIEYVKLGVNAVVVGLGAVPREGPAAVTDS